MKENERCCTGCVQCAPMRVHIERAKETFNLTFDDLTSHIVTGHSAYRVAECGGYQAGGRGQDEFDECHQYQFGTERHDAAGQSSRDE